MAEFQITYWRELPSLVVSREGGTVTKAPLPQRFQDTIDEAAMRLGEVSSDAYLDGWRRSDWTVEAGTPSSVAEAVVTRLEEQWTPEALVEYVSGLGDDRSGEDER